MSDIVNTIIDKQAFEQVDQLAKKLEVARLELVELIGTAQKVSFNNIQLPKDLDAHFKKVATQRQEIAQATDKERLAELELQQAREKAFVEYEKRLKKEQAAREKQVKAESDLRQRLAKQKEQEAKQEIAQANRKAREDVLQVENQKILGRNAREMAKLSSSLTTAYEKQSIVLERMRRRYKDVAVSQGENSAEARKLQREIQTLDQKLKQVDANVGQFQRNVGNYSKAWRSLGGVLRSTASAFGLVGGAMMFAGIIRNGIARIREFDKEMQNLAGIVGTSRSEIEGLEQTIIDVAGASIKTSNEVAKLATSLISLGKTPAEVQLLLKPVNDLAIALQATSDEAGELLVQTLNAFGKGAESGDEFANIIAKVRSSTALDFGRIRDSLGYVSATASALGLSLEETAAILGTLNDNGIKAARAGRLMNSTFGRLNQAGMSLNDALDQINNSTDKVATATQIFGTEAFSLGLILADNTQKTKEYTEAFEDAGGALDSLVNEQLQSLDAHIKILDSSWEKLVLTFDNGSGVISRSLKFILSGLTAIIDSVAFLNDDGTVQAQKVYNDVLMQQADYYRELGEEAEAYARIDQQRAEESLARSERDLKALEAINDQLRANADEMGKGRATITIRENEKRMEQLRITAGRYRAQLQAANDVLGEGVDAIEEIEDALEGVAERQKEIALGGKLLDSLGIDESDTSKTLQYTVGWFEQLVSTLQKLQKETARSSEEWKYYADEIERVQDIIDRMNQRDLSIDIDSSFAGLLDRILIEKGMNSLSQTLGEDLQALYTEFANNYEIDYENFKRFSQMKIEQSDLEQQKKMEGIAMWMQVSSDAIHEVGNLFAAFADRRIQKIDDQIREDEERTDRLLRNEALTEEQRKQIEQESEIRRQQLEQKKAREQEKAARTEKAFAMFDIALNTAAAIMKTFAQLGFPAGVPMSIAVGAIGALQLATVAAKPIPKYKHGRKDGKAEVAVVGDGYRPEVITDKDGNVKQVTPARPTLTYLDKGDEVFPSVKAYQKSLDYDSILRASLLTNIASQTDRITAADLGNVFDRKLSDIDRKIREGIKDGFQNIQINNKIKNDNSALLRELSRQRRRDV